MCLVKTPSNLWLAQRIAGACRCRSTENAHGNGPGSPPKNREPSTPRNLLIVVPTLLFVASASLGHFLFATSGGFAYLGLDAGQHWLTTAALTVAVFLGHALAFRNTPQSGRPQPDAELAYWALGGLCLPLLVLAAVQSSLIWLLPAMIFALAARVVIGKTSGETRALDARALDPLRH